MRISNAISHRRHPKRRGRLARARPHVRVSSLRSILGSRRTAHRRPRDVVASAADRLARRRR